MEDLIRRSDAIAILKDLQSKHLQFCLVPFRIAIEKVQAIPSAESTGDLDNAICEYVKEGLMANPYDRPQGEWSIDSIDEIELSYGGTAYEPVYKCSHCGRTTESYVRFDKPLMPEDANFPNFCGWCGAQMKGANDE